MLSPGRSGAPAYGRDRMGRGRTPLGLASLLYVGLVPVDAVAVLPGRSPTAVVGIAVIGLWLMDLVAGAHRRGGATNRPTAIYVSSFAFVAWTVIALTWSINPESSLVRVVSYVALALSVPALARGMQGQFTLPMAVYVLSTTFASVCMLAGWGATDVSEFAGDPTRATVYENNPNILSLILTVGVAFAALLAANSRGWRRSGYAVAALTCGMGSLAAGSKTGLLALIAVAVSVPLLSGRRLRVGRFVGMVALILLGATLLWSLRSWFPPRLTETWDSLQSGEFTTRQDIWQTALDHLDEWMPWGIGVNNSAEYLSWFYGFHVLHNTFLELAVELGLVGLLLGVLFYIAVLLDNRFSPYRDFVVVGLVPLGVFAMSTSLFYFKLQWMLAAMAAVRMAGTPDKTADHGQGNSHYKKAAGRPPLETVILEAQAPTLMSSSSSAVDTPRAQTSTVRAP